MTAYEVNFDGIVGPTHHYGGLSYGNVASMRNKLSVSHPKQAALQGLAKMKFMADLGLKQAVLPPHERPHLPTLRRLGYSGSDAAILGKVVKEDPWLLSAVSNASAMWAANAATVSPSADTADGRVHFSPANLVTQFHRSIEAKTTTSILRRIFPDQSRFLVHEPLPPSGTLADEGAANHTRLCRTYGDAGFELFTYGALRGDESDHATPVKYPARQTAHASVQVARRHGLSVERAALARQNPEAIDAGAFHNDVVAVGNRTVLFRHERAWIGWRAAEAQLRSVLPDLKDIVVSDADVPLGDAIASYLFNSQLVTLPDGRDVLVAPTECRENERVRVYLDRGAFEQVYFVDVRQSMRNGGGPACLRLRVVLTEAELAATHQGVMFTDALHASLGQWVEKHYRDELSAEDLGDPRLLEESRAALDELTGILRLGSLYEFQR
jgi:succinylarginine dihydrolase